MNLLKKVIGAGTSAALVASLLATAAVPAALADTSVSGTVAVPVGGTSSGTALALTFNDATTFVAGLGGPGFCAVTNGGTTTQTLTYTIKDSANGATLHFTGTPTFAPGLPGSLGASVALAQSLGGIANDSFTVTITGCDPNNVEQFTVTGLQIAASSSAATGTITGNLSGTNGFVAAITGTTTKAIGTLQAAITGTAGGPFNINVTSTCPFVVGPVGLSTTANFSDISDARSITAVGAVVGNIQTVTFGTGLYGHAITTTVTQTVGACSTFSSPGTVGSVATQNTVLQTSTQQQVNPGQQNQLAGTTSLGEPSAGFLTGTVTYKISAAGVLFSTPPTVSVPVQTALVAPTNLVATAANLAGTLPAATYTYEVTALGVTNTGTGVGETAVSAVATATLATTGSIALTWTAVPGATGYNLYRNSAGYKLLATTTTATTFTDLGTVALGAAPVSGGAFLAAPTGVLGTLGTLGTLTAGTRYYAVAAMNGAGQTVGSAPALVTISSGSNNSVAVSWNAVPGATSYAVYEAATLVLLNTAATPQYWLPGNVTTFLDTGVAGTAGGTILAASTATIAAPGGLAGTATANSGGLAANTYYYVITATNAAGQTPISNEVNQAVLANGSISLGWTAVAGATGYNIYRSTSAGTEVFLVSVGAVVVYVDNGTAVPTLVIPPIANTTAGTAMTVVGLCALSFDRTSCTATISTASVGLPSTITLSNIFVDVASTVPYGTAVNLIVTTSPLVTLSVTANTIAYVAQALLAVSVQAIPTVYIDYNAQPSGVITVSESQSGFFQAGSSGNNVLSLCITDQYTPWETFTFAPYASVRTGGDLLLLNTTTHLGATLVQGTLNANATCATWTVYSASTKASTIDIVGANAAGALSASVPTNGPTLSVMTNAIVGPVVMTVTSGGNVAPTYSKQVTNAMRAFKSGVTVSAASQPAIAPGTTGQAGNVSFAETLNGQLVMGEYITCQVLWTASQENQQVYMSAANANSLPTITTGGGLIAHLVAFNTTSNSFTMEVDQQAYAPQFGSITVGNIWYTVMTATPLGPVQIECWNGTISQNTSPGSGVFNHYPGTNGANFDQFVSNAIVGTAPVVTANAITTSGTALGATKVGPFTITPTKLPKAGKYVTWKFSTGSALVGKNVQIWVATKNSAGKWSAFKLLTTRRVDTSGNAYFWWRTSSKAWISVRAGYLTTLSVATQARWM